MLHESYRKEWRTVSHLELENVQRGRDTTSQIIAEIKDLFLVFERVLLQQGALDKF